MTSAEITPVTLPEGFFYVGTRSRSVLHLATDARSRHTYCGRNLGWTAGECLRPAYYAKMVKLCTRCAAKLAAFLAPRAEAASVELPPAADVTLTELERDLLAGCYTSDYHDGGSHPSVWTWSINAKIARPEQRAGVISSLVKKGLVVVGGAGDEASVTVTDRGQEVAEREGLAPRADRTTASCDAFASEMFSRLGLG